MAPGLAPIPNIRNRKLLKHLSSDIGPERSPERRVWWGVPDAWLSARKLFTDRVTQTHGQSVGVQCFFVSVK